MGGKDGWLGVVDLAGECGIGMGKELEKERNREGRLARRGLEGGEVTGWQAICGGGQA